MHGHGVREADCFARFASWRWIPFGAIHRPFSSPVVSSLLYAGMELSEALVRGIMQYVGADSSDMGFDLMGTMTIGNVDAAIGCLVNRDVPRMRESGSIWTTSACLSAARACFWPTKTFA